MRNEVASAAVRSYPETPRWTPKKVLFIANQYHPNIIGGAEVSVQTLAEEIHGRGVGVCVISLSPTAHDTQDTVNGIRVYRLSVSNLYTPFGPQRSALTRLVWHLLDTRNARMAAKVAEILDVEQPDWVSTHNLAGFSVAVWGQVKARGIGLGHVLHDYYLLCPRTTMFKGDRNCSGQCGTCLRLSAPKRAASADVDLVIGISRHVLEAHVSRGYFAAAQKAVIHNARRWDGPAPARLDQDLQGKLRIGYIGRIEPSKGIEVLLRAVSSLPEDRWTLRIAGRASMPDYIAELRRTFTRPEVDFVGYMRPADFYPSIDVLIVPSSWNEPLGMVAVESLQFGVPVIVTRAGGLPEILGASGAGWVFEPGDDAQLTGILGSLLEDRKPLGERRSRAEQLRSFFMPARQADEFLAALSAFRQHDQRVLADS